MGNKWWVKHEFNPEEPECVKCGKTMRLKDGHEWDDEEAYNLCWECLVEVLKEDEKTISFLRTSSTLATSPVIGFCKECSAPLSHDNKIKGYSVLYECPVCGQPHSIDEILPVGTLESTYYTEQEQTDSGGTNTSYVSTETVTISFRYNELVESPSKMEDGKIFKMITEYFNKSGFNNIKCINKSSIKSLEKPRELKDTEIVVEAEQYDDNQDLCVNGDFNSFFPLHPVVTTRKISMKMEKCRYEDNNRE